MSNLKAIKNRITSVKNIQKITKAMKMVASAKVKKAEKAVRASRPFTWELFHIFSQIQEELKDIKLETIETKRPLDNYPALLKSRDVKTVAFLIMTSNKGLAGAYSSNVVRYAIKRITEAKNEGKNVKVYLVGQKALAPLKNAQRNLDFEICNVYTKVVDDLNPLSALVVSEDLASVYVKEEVDEIVLITTRYQNMMTYKVESWTLLPAVEAGSGFQNLKKFHTDETNVKKHFDTQMLFEPNPKEILAKIVPMYITNVIYQALLEACASELASRMTAMSSAMNNADDMIKTLTVDYNKARQEQITQELTEIISGAGALK